MSIFDKVVDEALSNTQELTVLRAVVEKEILHHDILRTLKEQDLLNNLTFIGGTCLRCCYGGARLSEDLDFTGGSNFKKDDLKKMVAVLLATFENKYALPVQITEPSRAEANVSTWKIKIITRPENKSLPEQRINIDICAIPSYEKQPRMLINHYDVGLGTNGLIIQAQSLEEIFTDKLLAFALRPNRIKYRDVWDILWLTQKNIKPRFSLISKKIKDHKSSQQTFIDLFKERVAKLRLDPLLQDEFRKEMTRFLPVTQMHIIDQKDMWQYICLLMKELEAQVHSEVIL